MNAVRSISDIGRSFSHGKNLHSHGKNAEECSPKKTVGNQLELPKVGSLPKDIQKECSQSDLLRNAHFMKKLPLGAEASNVLVGEVDFLQRHITAFVRLKDSKILGDLTEVRLILVSRFVDKKIFKEKKLIKIYKLKKKILGSGTNSILFYFTWSFRSFTSVQRDWTCYCHVNVR